MQVPVATTYKLFSTLGEAYGFIGNARDEWVCSCFSQLPMQFIHCSVLPLKIMGGEFCWTWKTETGWPSCSGHLRARKAKRILCSQTSKPMKWGIKKTKSNEMLWVMEKKSPIKVSFQIHFKSGERIENGGKLHLQVSNRWKVCDKHKWLFLSTEIHVYVKTNCSIWGAFSYQTLCMSVHKYTAHFIWL